MGLRVKPLRPDKPAPCAKPPRARPEVDAPTTQATANTAAKTRFITHSFLSCAAARPPFNHPTESDFFSVAWIEPILRCSERIRQWKTRTGKDKQALLIRLKLAWRCKHAPEGNGCENVCDLTVEFAGLIAAGLFANAK
jgi:hypothetical protein